MKEVTLSTGQTATIRTKDELTEGQSRKIEIARSRGAAARNTPDSPKHQRDRTRKSTL
jgi:hypothetical protein